MRKARNGYQLQRGVPKDVQPVMGKTIWVEGAGLTYASSSACRLSLLQRTIDSVMSWDDDK